MKMEMLKGKPYKEIVSLMREASISGVGSENLKQSHLVGQKRVISTFSIGIDNTLNANKQLHRYVKGQKVKFLRDLSFQEGSFIKDNYKDFNGFNQFKIMVTVMPPTRSHLDPPNLYPTVKALIDGFTDAGFWNDDNFRHLAEVGFRYGGLSGEKRVYKLILDMEEIEPQNLDEYIMDV